MQNFSLFSSKKNTNDITAHVLMPAYNVESFISNSICSVMNQNHLNLKLIIVNDGSTDATSEIILKHLELNYSSKDKIIFISETINSGIAKTRSKLLEFSKKINSEAYIFWLDADDQYVSPFVISSVLKKMLLTKADICLIDFSILYEEENQKNNATALIGEKTKVTEIIEKVSTIKSQFIQPNNCDFDILEFTSLGWTKCYAPTINLPTPAPYNFEDFVYMSALLQAKIITALSGQSIQYLRRSTSVCGQRTSEHFINDIPIQLKTFFDTVIADNKNDLDLNRKATMAKNFVDRKLDQYKNTLTNIVDKASEKSEINQDTLDKYQDKMLEIKKYINQTLDFLKNDEASHRNTISL